MNRFATLSAKVRKADHKSVLLFSSGAAIALLGVSMAGFLASNRVSIPYNQSGMTIKWLPGTVKAWKPQIEQMGKKYNIDPNFIAIIMTLESGGYAKAGSEADAKGLMQVIPPTAQDIAAKHLKTPVKTYDIWKPTTNIEFGTAYLSWLRDEFGTAEQGPDFNSTIELVAAGYNGGPGAANSLEQGKGLEDTQTVVYSRDAFNMWRERHSNSSPTFDRWKERGGSLLIELAEKQ